MVIKFTDFSGNVCEIRIGSDTTSQYYTYAAPDAFSIEEQSTDDFSVPVRTQSGNINIIDTGSVWESMLPINGGAMPLYFYRGSTCEWKGYVYPGTFGCAYLDMPSRVSIPVVCPLTMLNAYDFRPSIGIVTIYSLLQDIFESDRTIQLSYAITSQDSADIASLKVMGATFYDVDAEGNYTPKYTCLEALQEICTICGLTARWTGLSVVLEGLPTASLSPIALTMPFADANQEQRYIPGFRKVVVEPREEEINTFFEIPGQYITNKTVADAGVIRFQDYNTHYSDVSSGVYVWIAGTYGGDAVAISLTTPALVIEADNLNYSNYGSNVGVYDRYQAADPSNPQVGKGSFQWTSLLRVWGAGNTNIQHEACIKITTRQAYALSNGFLVLNAGIVSVYERSTVSGSIVCTIKAGNKYWSGQSWVTSQKAVVIGFSNGQITNNREVSTVWGNYDGYGMFIGNDALSGTIVLTIYDVLGIQSHTIGLTNLQMEFVRQQDNRNQKRRIFTAESNAKFTSTKEISVSLCSDNPYKTLSNVLLDSNNAPVDKITIGQETIRPEQWIANGLLGIYSNARYALKLNMRGCLMNTANYTVNNSEYHCFAAAHDFANDSTTINLVKI